MGVALAIAIIGKLLPILIQKINAGDNWQDVRLGDIDDLKSCKELEKELRLREHRNF